MAWIETIAPEDADGELNRVPNRCNGGTAAGLSPDWSVSATRLLELR